MTLNMDVVTLFFELLGVFVSGGLFTFLLISCAVSRNKKRKLPL